MNVARCHLVSGCLYVIAIIIKREHIHAATNPGFSVFNNELNTKNITITIKPVRITINVERKNIFIFTQELNNCPDITLQLKLSNLYSISQLLNFQHIFEEQFTPIP